MLNFNISKYTQKFSTKSSRNFFAVSFAVATATSFCLYSKYADAQSENGALSPNEARGFKVKKVNKLTDETYSVLLDTSGKKNGVSTTSCVMVSIPGINDEKGNPISKPYTPINANQEDIELIIKSYPDGKLSKNVPNLKLGSTVNVQGPFPKIPFDLAKAKSMKEIYFIGAGSGATPGVQLIQSLAREQHRENYKIAAQKNSPQMSVPIKFIYASRESNESKAYASHILPFVDRFFGFVEKSGPRFLNFLPQFSSKLPDSASSLPIQHGYYQVPHKITEEHLDLLINDPSDKSFVFVCGPKSFVEYLAGSKAPDRTQGELSGYLKKRGFKAEQVFKF